MRTTNIPTTEIAARTRMSVVARWLAFKLPSVLHEVRPCGSVTERSTRCRSSSTAAAGQVPALVLQRIRKSLDVLDPLQVEGVRLLSRLYNSAGPSAGLKKREAGVVGVTAADKLDRLFVSHVQKELSSEPLF